MKKQLQSLTPAALCARVSGDRQDVDLSVAAQLRAMRDYARNNGYSVAREYVDEAEWQNRRPPPVPPDDRRGRQGHGPFPGDSGLEVFEIHPQAGARRSLQVHAEAQWRTRRS